MILQVPRDLGLGMMEETSHPNLDVGDPLVGKCGSIKSFNIFKSSTRCTITTTCSNTTIKRSVAFQTTSTNHFFLFAIFCLWNLKESPEKNTRNCQPKRPSGTRCQVKGDGFFRLENSTNGSWSHDFQGKGSSPENPEIFFDSISFPIFCGLYPLYPKFLYGSIHYLFFEIIHF